MWLEAILTKTDLETALRQFSPLTIRLGDNGSLLLAEPKELSLIPDRGIGIVCDAMLQWPVLGFNVPVSLHGLTVHVLPVVDEAAAGKPLVFRMQIDHTGVAMLPAMFDHSVTAMINDELTKKHVELSWKFIETLSHEFGLPDAIVSAASISLVATAGMVKANGTALGLAVKFETRVRNRVAATEPAAGAEASLPPAAPDDDALPAPSQPGPRATNGAAHPGVGPAGGYPLPQAFDPRSFIVGGAVTAVALTALGGLTRLVRGR